MVFFKISSNNSFNIIAYVNNVRNLKRICGNANINSNLDFADKINQVFNILRRKRRKYSFLMIIQIRCFDVCNLTRLLLLKAFD